MKLYVTDLDDTFLTPQGKVSKTSKDIINSLLKEGLLFSIATARLITQAKWILEELELNIPVVLGNGAMLYSLEKNEILYENFIDNKDLKRLIAYFEEENIPLFVMAVNSENKDKLFYKANHLSDVMQRYFDRYQKDQDRFVKVESFHSLDVRGVVKLRTLGSFEQLVPVKQFIDQNFSCQTYLTREFGEEGVYGAFEVNHKNVGKHVGALKLKEIVKAEKLVCFGDEANDIPLFEKADFSYAVQGAIEELKQIAFL